MTKTITRAGDNIQDRELVLTRIFNAAPDRVWQAWTSPDNLAQWWGPNGFTLTTQSMELAAGGVWRFIMHGPDGRDYQNRIRYIEVQQPERLVYVHDGEEGEPVHFEVTVTFTEQNGKTVVEMRSLFPSAEDLRRVDKEYGAIEGAKQHMANLGLFLAKGSPSPDLVLERTFNAPRILVFKAWAEQERLAEWWGPKCFTNSLCEVDFRTGGLMNVHMQSPDGTTYPMSATFHEIHEPEKIVFSSRPLGEDGQPMFEVLHTVTLIEENNKTTLTLQASIASISDSETTHHLQGMEQGWSQSLDKLVDYIWKNSP